MHGGSTYLGHKLSQSPFYITTLNVNKQDEADFEQRENNELCNYIYRNLQGFILMKNKNCTIIKDAQMLSECNS